mmetsp:Transcript_36283/g.91382  ORF Transcript_36283/g.91382 Transcript_36283/m.91382 type:complete len:125 (+) Transcript_36283:214-588(+)
MHTGQNQRSSARKRGEGATLSHAPARALLIHTSCVTSLVVLVAKFALSLAAALVRHLSQMHAPAQPVATRQAPTPAKVQASTTRPKPPDSGCGTLVSHCSPAGCRSSPSQLEKQRQKFVLRLGL